MATEREERDRKGTGTFCFFLFPYAIVNYLSVSLFTLIFNVAFLMTFLKISFQASTAVPPQLWQPSSGILMTNDISETNPEEAVPCFALSKNDSYVMSASGGKISLFNMMTFKVFIHQSFCLNLIDCVSV